MSKEILAKLTENKFRNSLIAHSFFNAVKTQPLTREQVAVFLAQWWHPLHYFPTFLSRLVSVVPSVEMKTAISKILWQELGEADPARAHERIYISTMTDVGFAREQFVDVEMSPATTRLLDGYEKASLDPLRGLGFLYGTEVADLVMVSGIGRAVRKVTGVSRLPWVVIHAQQEPDHVDMANISLGDGADDAEQPAQAFSAQEEAVILAGAEEMWGLWVDFFSTLNAQMFHTDNVPSQATA